MESNSDVVTQTDLTKSVRNHCVIEVFLVAFYVVTLFFNFSVGFATFVIVRSQISSFFSYNLNKSCIEWSACSIKVKMRADFLNVVIPVQVGFDTKTIKDRICSRFPELVDSLQLIVREDLFIDAYNMSVETRAALRDVIKEHGESYPEFGEQLPEQYKVLQEKIGMLRQQGKRIIPYSLLEATNKSLVNPLSPEELQLFVQFQHNCGFLLHYKDIHLKDFVVLDPKIVIDATKCIVTSERFTTEMWDKAKWMTMVNTGQIEESYILRVWSKSNEQLFYRHREYLLMLMQRLDIIAKPRLYDGGDDAPVAFYYVPCMLQANNVVQGSEVTDKDITLIFKFKDLLPPAVVHKVFASCLCLWPVESNCLYDRWADFASGPNHLLLLRGKSNSIVVSIRHRHNAAQVDINLVRSIKHFLDQTIRRVVSLYGVDLENDREKIYIIECNEVAFSRGIETKSEKVRMLLKTKNLSWREK